MLSYHSMKPRYLGLISAEQLARPLVLSWVAQACAEVTKWGTSAAGSVMTIATSLSAINISSGPAAAKQPWQSWKTKWSKRFTREAPFALISRTKAGLSCAVEVRNKQRIAASLGQSICRVRGYDLAPIERFLRTKATVATAICNRSPVEWML